MMYHVPKTVDGVKHVLVPKSVINNSVEKWNSSLVGQGLGKKEYWIYFRYGEYAVGTRRLRTECSL